MTTEGSTKCTSSAASPFGRTPPVGPGGMTAKAFGLALAPANLSARQAKEAGLLTSGTYGPPSSTSSALCDRSESLVNRLRAVTDALGSTLYTLTWTQQSTPAGWSIYQLRASARRTSDSACTGWPTTRAADGAKNVRTFEGALSEIARKGSPQDLSQAAALSGWPTPAKANGDGGHAQWRGELGGVEDSDQRQRAPWRPEPASLACGWAHAESAGRSVTGGVAYADGLQPEQLAGSRSGSGEAFGGGAHGEPAGPSETCGTGALRDGARPGPTNGFWADADWILCADPDGPRWRPVEPWSFPLAHGATARVGRLRGYGDAIVAPLAEAFLRCL